MGHSPPIGAVYSGEFLWGTCYLHVGMLWEPGPETLCYLHTTTFFLLSTANWMEAGALQLPISKPFSTVGGIWVEEWLYATHDMKDPGGLGTAPHQILCKHILSSLILTVAGGRWPGWGDRSGETDFRKLHGNGRWQVWLSQETNFFKSCGLQMSISHWGKGEKRYWALSTWFIQWVTFRLGLWESFPYKLDSQTLLGTILK